MKMRLIDADALKDWSEIVPLTDDGGIDINDFEEKLESMPTVEAIPVSWIQETMQLAETVGAEKYAELLGVLLDDWAERKEE